MSGDARLEEEILHEIKHNDGLAPTTLIYLFSCRHTTWCAIQDAACRLVEQGKIELDSKLVWRLRRENT